MGRAPPFQACPSWTPTLRCTPAPHSLGLQCWGHRRQETGRGAPSTGHAGGPALLTTAESRRTSALAGHVQKPHSEPRWPQGRGGRPLARSPGTARRGTGPGFCPGREVTAASGTELQASAGGSAGALRTPGPDSAQAAGPPASRSQRRCGPAAAGNLRPCTCRTRTSHRNAPTLPPTWAPREHCPESPTARAGSR